MLISEVESWDLVWPRKSETGQMGWKRVLAAYSNFYETKVAVTVRDAETGEEQCILSNLIHPFLAQVPVAETRVPVSMPMMNLATEGHV